MLFDVVHTTRFAYSAPVHLDPLTVRLRPRTDRSQRLLRFEITVHPDPAGSSDLSDLEGNDLTQFWFTGSTNELTLTTTCTAETLRTNPFDYIVLNPAAHQVPMTYPKHESRALRRYLSTRPDAEVHAFALDVVRASGGEAGPFLLELATRIAESHSTEVRLEGGPLPPGETLSRRRAACRDLSLLFMAACRSVGVASRFVSGYQAPQVKQEINHLHAWSEVFLSGVGWRGYDPSAGLAVADSHLALASAAIPSGTAPTEGTYRSNGAFSRLESGIEISVRGAPIAGKQSVTLGGDSAFRSDQANSIGAPEPTAWRVASINLPPPTLGRLSGLRESPMPEGRFGFRTSR